VAGVRRLRQNFAPNLRLPRAARYKASQYQCVFGRGAFRVFFIFWRGAGLLVPVFAVLAFGLMLGVSWVAQQLGVSTQVAGTIAPTIAAIPVAVLLWLIGSRPPRLSSFYFIPMRFWAPVIAALGLFVSYSVFQGHGAKPAPAKAPVAAQSSSPEVVLTANGSKADSKSETEAAPPMETMPEITVTAKRGKNGKLEPVSISSDRFSGSRVR
jgi:hypothetical protein